MPKIDWRRTITAALWIGLFALIGQQLSVWIDVPFLTDYKRFKGLLVASSQTPPLDVKVFPQNVALGATDSLGNCPSVDTLPCEVQFVAASLEIDGSVTCTDGPYNEYLDPLADPNTDYATLPPWTLAICDSAAALLDYSLLQDTIRYERFVRFTWVSQPDSVLAAWDSIQYHIMVRTTDSGQYLFDSLTVHPDTVFDWRWGMPNVLYDASVWTRAINADTSISAPASPWVTFGYPTALDSIIVHLVVPVMLPAVTVDSIIGDTIP